MNCLICKLKMRHKITVNTPYYNCNNWDHPWYYYDYEITRRDIDDYGFTLKNIKAGDIISFYYYNNKYISEKEIQKYINLKGFH